jgi:hypothetical protein
MGDWVCFSSPSAVARAIAYDRFGLRLASLRCWWSGRGWGDGPDVRRSPCLLPRRWSCSCRFRSCRRSCVSYTRCRSPGDCRGWPGTSDFRNQRRSSPPCGAPRMPERARRRSSRVPKAVACDDGLGRGVANVLDAAHATASQRNFGPGHAVRPHRSRRMSSRRASLRRSQLIHEDTADRPGHRQARHVSASTAHSGSRLLPKRNSQRLKNVDSRMNAAQALHGERRFGESTDAARVRRLVHVEFELPDQAGGDTSEVPLIR